MYINSGIMRSADTSNHGSSMQAKQLLQWIEYLNDSCTTDRDSTKSFCFELAAKLLINY